MKDFWKWFKNKTGFTKEQWQDCNRENWMINLIGHMEEYIILNGQGIGNGSYSWKRIREGVSYQNIRYEDLQYWIDERIKKQL